MAEQWRDIAGYDGVYQVSDQGQVRNTQTGKILQPVKMKNGRLYVTLSSSGFQRKCTVHSLVASAFLGDCPPNHEITHKDGDCTHSEVSNLEYVTRRENQKRFVMRTGGYSVNLTKRVQTPQECGIALLCFPRTVGSSPMALSSTTGKNGTQRVRITWNGARPRNESACRWGRIQPTPVRDGCAKRPN